MSDLTPIYITHFSHPHGYFFSSTSDIQKSIHCEACGDEISTRNGPFYASCDRCKKFMHKICTELPREICNHPFHQHHPLTLLVPPPDELAGATCHACGDTIRNFRYRCRSELCDFDLDLKCSTLIHMTASDVVREHQLCSQQIPHPHPLIFCRSKDPSFDFYCGACGLPFEKKGDRAFIYVCLECRLLLHNSCADWPPEITNHPFHPHHCLSIHQKREFSCSACHSSWNTISFQCTQNCDFQLDILCATLISKVATSTTKYHKHPLIDCYVDQQVNKFHSPCPACNQPFKDSLSFCSDCRILVHKSCIELPFRITHSFHSHQLQLSSSRIQYFKCHACLESQHGFMSYKCVSFNCGYRSCLRCTFMGSSVIKDCSSHLTWNHLLYSFEFQPRGSKFDCNRCGHQIFTPFFRCIRCNFNLHFHCLSRLPPAVTHNIHRHTLTLTYLPIKDHPDEDENAELYCDSCEERRDLLHPSYYCAECHYVAHVHCVRMQVFQYIVQEPTTKELYKSYTAMTSFLKSSTLTRYLPIQHHLHPQHPLTLSVSTDFGQKEKFRCSICLSSCHNLAYVCDLCMFYLDLECASIPMPSKTKSEPQQLELDFFSHLPLELELYCSKCCRMISTPFVYCQECNFALHDKCLIESGHNVKHECHKDPLTFIFPDKNHNMDGEYMCNRCSKKGNFRDPTYICAECNYTVHIGCILPNEIACLLQKLTLTERPGNMKVDQNVSSDSWLDQFNPTLSAPHQTINELKEIGSTNSTNAESNVGNQEVGQNAAVINSVQLAEVDKKIAKLLAELEELKEIRAQLIASSSVGTTT